MQLHFPKWKARSGQLSGPSVTVDVGNVCDLFSFTISYTICSSRRGQKETIFAKTALAYFLCVQDLKLQLPALSKQLAVKSTSPNYEWDAKTKKGLSYQTVISGKMQYFRT